MFHMIKILGGRIGVPEPERITLESAVSVKYGTPVRIVGGTLTKTDATATALPTHVTLADSEGKEVLVAALSPEMIFEVPASADPTGMKIGTEYLLGADSLSVSATAAASGKRGAVLVNAAGASAKGDNLLVRFPAV